MDASSIQQDCAAPTYPLSTTEPSTLELEIISQNVDERGVGVGYHGSACAVDIELDGLGQGSKLLKSLRACNCEPVAALRASDSIHLVDHGTADQWPSQSCAPGRWGICACRGRAVRPSRLEGTRWRPQRAPHRKRRRYPRSGRRAAAPDGRRMETRGCGLKNLAQTCPQHRVLLDPQFLNITVTCISSRFFPSSIVFRNYGARYL